MNVITDKYGNNYVYINNNLILFRSIKKIDMVRNE